MKSQIYSNNLYTNKVLLLERFMLNYRNTLCHIPPIKILIEIREFYYRGIYNDMKGSNFKLRLFYVGPKQLENKSNLNFSIAINPQLDVYI